MAKKVKRSKSFILFIWQSSYMTLTFDLKIKAEMTELWIFYVFDLQIRGWGHGLCQNWGQLWLGNINIYFYAKFHRPSFKSDGDMSVLSFDLQSRGRGQGWGQNQGQFWLGNMYIYSYSKLQVPSLKNDLVMSILSFDLKSRGRGHGKGQNQGQFWLGNMHIYLWLFWVFDLQGR